ncbi:hypothetical protein [Leptolyngbya sp. KIOST-1]|uniref:hypothetical protein n=1 Tax=Leptolyngbya sp. KIOST-1 TaxID=1229172 RepID=UPI00055E28C2|nr:hypothetical protein [Leptolyngbya sp. KIOST-1]
MNRFIIGGILAAMVVMLTGGLNRLFRDRPQGAQLASQRNTALQQPGQQAGNDLGSVPLEQAGRLVQRQSEVGTNGIPAPGDSAFGTQTNGNGDPFGRAVISPDQTGTAPAAGNVIPRTGGATTFPANTSPPNTGGDIAPIQPGLVQPGEVPRPAPDPDLDSIPALW